MHNASSGGYNQGFLPTNMNFSTGGFSGTSASWNFTGVGLPQLDMVPISSELSPGLHVSTMPEVRLPAPPSDVVLATGQQQNGGSMPSSYRKQHPKPRLVQCPEISAAQPRNSRSTTMPPQTAIQVPVQAQRLPLPTNTTPSTVAQSSTATHKPTPPSNVLNKKAHRQRPKPTIAAESAMGKSAGSSDALEPRASKRVSIKSKRNEEANAIGTNQKCFTMDAGGKSNDNGEAQKKRTGASISSGATK
ncbi:hypothetical protein J3R83DRAFT_2293 [Lanmaoa asiatica]|nr:hypothetical protein J3R83DRAFT_2293 [Lanmaoa asiatica]